MDDNTKKRFLIVRQGFGSWILVNGVGFLVGVVLFFVAIFGPAILLDSLEMKSSSMAYTGLYLLMCLPLLYLAYRAGVFVVRLVRSKKHCVAVEGDTLSLHPSLVSVELSNIRLTRGYMFHVVGSYAGNRYSYKITYLHLSVEKSEAGLGRDIYLWANTTPGKKKLEAWDSDGASVNQDWRMTVHPPFPDQSIYEELISFKEINGLYSLLTSKGVKKA